MAGKTRASSKKFILVELKMKERLVAKSQLAEHVDGSCHAGIMVAVLCLDGIEMKMNSKAFSHEDFIKCFLLYFRIIFRTS